MRQWRTTIRGNEHKINKIMHFGGVYSEACGYIDFLWPRGVGGRKVGRGRDKRHLKLLCFFGLLLYHPSYILFKNNFIPEKLFQAVT